MITIRHIHDVYIHHHSEQESENNKLLKEIIKQQLQMANEINAYLDRVEAAIEGIRKDIQSLKDGLPTTGGLTAAELAQVKARLSAVVKSAEDLDAENTRPEVPEEPEPPTG